MPRSSLLLVITCTVSLVLIAGCFFSLQLIPLLSPSSSGPPQAPDGQLWRDIGQIDRIGPLVPQDTDGNGLFNSLDLTVTATTTISGHYSLLATLVDTNGTFVAPASFSTLMADAPLEAGQHAIVLSFDGEMIRRSGGDGPYRIERLTLEGSGYGVTTIDEVTNTRTTKPLRAREFEGPMVTVGTVNDEPRDSDGDGQSDTLALLVELEIIEPGEYEVYGRLVNEQWSEVGTTRMTVQLDEKALVVLAFDAHALAYNKINGPYTLSDFAIVKTDGSGVGLTEFEVHLTKPYQASDFELPTVPVVQFSQPRTQGGLSTGVVTMEIVFDPIPQIDGSVEFYTQDGTARDQQDYRGGVTRVHFKAGQKRMQLGLDLFDPNAGGNGGTFTIGMRDPELATIGMQSTIEVTLAPR